MSHVFTRSAAYWSSLVGGVVDLPVGLRLALKDGVWTSPCGTKVVHETEVIDNLLRDNTLVPVLSEDPAEDAEAPPFPTPVLEPEDAEDVEPEGEDGQGDDAGAGTDDGVEAPESERKEPPSDSAGVAAAAKPASKPAARGKPGPKPRPK